MLSFSHIISGFTLGFRHRRELCQLLENTPENSSILKLDPKELLASGVEGLALDFDGVLAHHGANVPLSEAVTWMKRCESVFGGNRLFILSNKPTEERKAWFHDQFPEIRFISGVRKKPNPDGLYEAGRLSGVPLSSILMVDDRLLTGCLAAIVAGARPCYIRKPFVLFRHRPLAEQFFCLLRAGERLFVRMLTL